MRGLRTSVKYTETLAPPLTLRPLAPLDAAALQALYQASAEHFVRAWGVPPPSQQALSDLADGRENDARALLGIFLQDVLIGVIDLLFGDDEPPDVRLGLVLLTPEFRRQGLGSWALRILEAWLARDTPVERITLFVSAQNHPAQAFFSATGYSYTGHTTRAIVGRSRPRLLQMGKTLG